MFALLNELKNSQNATYVVLNQAVHEISLSSFLQLFIFCFSFFCFSGLLFPIESAF